MLLYYVIFILALLAKTLASPAITILSAAQLWPPTSTSKLYSTPSPPLDVYVMSVGHLNLLHPLDLHLEVQEQSALLSAGICWQQAL